MPHYTYAEANRAPPNTKKDDRVHDNQSSKSAGAESTALSSSAKNDHEGEKTRISINVSIYNTHNTGTDIQAKSTTEISGNCSNRSLDAPENSRNSSSTEYLGHPVTIIEPKRDEMAYIVSGSLDPKESKGPVFFSNAAIAATTKPANTEAGVAFNWRWPDGCKFSSGPEMNERENISFQHKSISTGIAVTAPQPAIKAPRSNSGYKIPTQNFPISSNIYPRRGIPSYISLKQQLQLKQKQEHQQIKNLSGGSYFLPCHDQSATASSSPGSITYSDQGTERTFSSTAMVTSTNDVGATNGGGSPK